MTGFQADVFLLFKYILAAGPFQFSSISSSPTDSARGGKKMSLLRSGIWIQSWPSCWRGARGAPVQFVVGQSLCIALVRWHLRGLDQGGRDLKHYLGLGEKELSREARTLHRLIRLSGARCWVRPNGSIHGLSKMCVVCCRVLWDLQSVARSICRLKGEAGIRALTRRDLVPRETC